MFSMLYITYIYILCFTHRHTVGFSMGPSMASAVTRCQVLTVAICHPAAGRSSQWRYHGKAVFSNHGLMIGIIHHYYG